MMNKHRDEKYITQLQSKDGIWSYRVRFKGQSKTFSEAVYGNLAYKKAVAFRNKVVFEDVDEYDCSETVGDVFENLFDFFQLRSETERKYRVIFNKYMSKYELMKVTNVTTADVINCLNSMVLYTTDSVITRCLVIWRKISIYCLTNEYINRDFTVGIKCPKSRIISQPKEIATADKQTLETLIPFIREDFSIIYDRSVVPLILWTLYYTGCRPCEVMALTKKDVTKDYIYINKELGSDRKSIAVIRECKTPTSIRKIPIADDLRPYLDEAKKISKNELMFPNRFGDHYSVDGVGYRVHRVALNHGINFNMYALRHNFSTILIDSHVDPRTHQELMGHKNYTMSVNYARATNEKKINALKNL